MILITGKERGFCLTAREILFGMGIICELCEPWEVSSRLLKRHSAILSVGRDLGMEAWELVSGIRSSDPKIPIIAVREDFCSREAVLFDAAYPSSLYCALAVRRLCELAAERGIRRAGEYRTGELSVVAGRALLGGASLSLTKSEAAVLGSIIAFYPEKILAGKISELAFRHGREPSESGVRTHISAINKKLSAAGAPMRVFADDGYTLSELAATPL
ncbi:MAG: hypothetical protein IJF05_02760 [Clostridia bacterium]|nr:hypothetical protein [Clostridia bacterium]